MSLTVVSIACNNPDNGHFMGRFDAIHYGTDQDVELQHDHWGPRGGMSIRYLGDGRVRICRRVFQYEREKEWFGNWCWNGLWMKPHEARRLLRYLRDQGRWHCEAGPSRLYRWFNRELIEAPTGLGALAGQSDLGAGNVADHKKTLRGGYPT